MYSDEVLRNLAGANPPSGADNAKKMVGSAQGFMGVAGAASSIVNNILSGMFSRNQQERAHNLAIAQSVANAGIQESLWKTQLREGAARSVAGLKAAGLNPAMAQGGNLGTPPLTSSPGSPVPANPVPLQNPVDSLMQAKHLENETKIADAQEGLLKANTEKVENESGLLSKENDAFWERFTNEMAKIVSEKNRNEAGTTLDQKRVDEVEQSIEKLKVEIDDLKELKNYHHELGRLTQKQANNYDNYIGAQIRHYGSMAALNFGENARRQMNQLFEWTQASAMADYFDNQSALLRMERQMQEWQVMMAKRYGQAKWWIDAACEVIETGADAYYKFATGTSSIIPFSSRSITVAGKNKNGGSYSQTDYFQHRKFGW